MRKTLLFLAFCLFAFCPFAQIPLDKGWKFTTGDNPEYAMPGFNDSEWASINPAAVYEVQGYAGYDGYSWYRIHVHLPATLRQESALRDSVRFLLGKIDDVDAAYLNGVKIGQTGRFPDEPGGVMGDYDRVRRYVLPWKSPLIRWDADNVVAIRVYDGGGGGGLWGSKPNVDFVDLMDFVDMQANSSPFDFLSNGQMSKTIVLKNAWQEPILGYLNQEVEVNGQTTRTSKSIALDPNVTTSRMFEFDAVENARVTYTFMEKNSLKTRSVTLHTPYILTPKEKPEPRITNSAVYGARPGHPFLWAVRATGEAPMTFSAQNLPAGLTLDPATGIISGKTPAKAGEYALTLKATNRLGESERQVKIVVGEQLALTPPLGWNSWNCWGLAVSDARVRASADALVSSGLANHGWTYINIDDGWEAGRDAKGEIRVNEKFPDLKNLGDYLHTRGLKMGIYSSPGPKTCGGFEGSYGHEAQDITAYARWGVDYLKYDWCSYSGIVGENQKPTLEQMQHPYKIASEALRRSGRDIVFSLCQYGMGDVWKWGGDVGGQLWRTTGDIEDTWESLSGIGFSQAEAAPYARPGGWNDPDMLIVGLVGWGDQLHQTRLTPSEQYTHISLWALLSAPMLIGCDLSRMDPFTYNLLSNDEILAIDQDPLGKAARPVQKTADYQIWVKELADGSKAVGIFNLSEADRAFSIDWGELGFSGTVSVRDAWRQQDEGRFEAGKKHAMKVYGHGVQLFIVR